MKGLIDRQGSIRLGFLSFCLLGILILNIVEVELSGFLFIVTLVATGSYFVGNRGWLYWQNRERSQQYRYRETVGLVILAVLLNLMAAAESYPAQTPLTVIFGELAFFSLLLLYWVYKKRKKNDAMYVLGLSGIALVAVAALVFSVTTLALVDSPGNYDSVAGLVFLVLAATLLVAGVRWLVSQLRLLLKLKQEQTQSEIKHLQSQVNPHFFFNILNNLYGVTGQDAAKAQQLILKLSDLMRYSIYDGQKETVTLQAELAYLENYIALQQLRYQKEIEVDFEREIDDENYQLLPLLFIILVENAFKHGAEQLRKHAYVQLHVTATDGAVHFRIKNNYDATTISAVTGLGLANLRRRLLLAYPDRHDLTISDMDEIYEVKLSLWGIS